MGEQSSILVQKKMFLALTVVIFTLTIYLVNFYTKDKDIQIAVVNNKIVRIEKNEDDSIKSEPIQYTAIERIEEDTKEDIEEIIEQPITVNKTETVPVDDPPTEYKEVMEATATAYCLCVKCCGKLPTHPGYGITASGYKITPGIGEKVIAVDPNVIELGSRVYVEGLNGAKNYGYAIAADTGSAIKNIKIDLYMDSHQDTLNWGVKKVKVYVMN